MPPVGTFNAAVVGSGPNGLAAALTLARAGVAVDVYEGSATAGGGCRTAELTLPGFRHDVCSAVHPLMLASPFFRTVDLAARGINMLTPPVAFAHPLDGGRAAAVLHSVEETATSFGRDSKVYRRLFGPLVADMGRILPFILGPSARPPGTPSQQRGWRSPACCRHPRWQLCSRPRKRRHYWRALRHTRCSR